MTAIILNSNYTLAKCLLLWLWLLPATMQAKANATPDSLTATAPTRIYAGNTATITLQLYKANSKAQQLQGPITIWLNGQPTPVDFKNGIGMLPVGVNKTATYTVSLSKQQVGTNVSITKLPGWLTLLPPLMAILLALLTREVISSLLVGILTGSVLMQGFSPYNWLQAAGRAFDTYITHAFANTEHASVILFSLMVGGLVALVSANGGMEGIVRWLSQRARTRNRAQGITWLMGLAIFFDDYANTLVVGNTMRPLTDRYKISREKLAYLVDSTAAPVACLALVTTWIGAELGYIEAVLPQTNIKTSAYGVFTGSLRYSYYPIFTIVFMGALIFMRRDFGPMYRAECATLNQQNSSNTNSPTPTTAHDAFANQTTKKPMALMALLPILALIGTTLGGLVATGLANTSKLPSGGWLLHAGSVIGASDPYAALMWGAAAGLSVAMALTLATGRLPLEQAMEAILGGIKSMLPAMIILLLAWALADTIAEVNTASYLSGLFGQTVPPKWVPLLAMLLAAAVSFSTGSSWGTMAVVYPLLLPTSWLICQQAGYDLAASQVVFEHTVAAILGGAVLGDHCSPISDTTILSSLSSGCNHLSHVRTQMPYALAVAGICLLVSGLLFPLGMPWWAMLPVGVGLTIGTVVVFGKKIPI